MHIYASWSQYLEAVLLSLGRILEYSSRCVDDELTRSLNHLSSYIPSCKDLSNIGMAMPMNKPIRSVVEL